MFRQLTLCNAFGAEVNTFNPKNLYLKAEINSSSAEQEIFQTLIDDQSNVYPYNAWTIAISDIVFSLGSGTGNDNWSLYTGQYENNSASNTITGIASDGNLSVASNYSINSLYPNPTNNKQLPYYYHWNKQYNIGNNAYTNDLVLLPQYRITVLERNNENQITHILINIKENDWNQLFTPDGISWQTHMFPNDPIVANDYGLGTGNSYDDCTLAITNGLGWEGCEYPQWSSAESMFIPYNLLEGKDINIGIQLTLAIAIEEGAVVEAAWQSSFSQPAMDEFYHDNVGLVPYINFLPTDDFGLGDISVNQYNIEFDSQGPSVNVDEQINGSLDFSINNFEGQASVYVFDNSDIGTPEYASIFGSTLMHTNYNEIDDMANYGIVDFSESDEGTGNIGFGTNVEIGDNTLHRVNFTYYPTGQIGTDSFSFFIVLHSLSDIAPQTYLDEFEVLEPYQKILFCGSTTVTINYAGFELTDEEYVPHEDGVAIENPSDVMFHLAEQELGYNQDVNVDKIVNARNNQSDFKLAFSVNKEIEGKKLFQEIAQSSKSVPTFNNGVLSFAYLQDTYTKTENDLDPIFTINEQDVIKYKISRTALDKIYTKIQVQYKYDYARDNYLESVIRIAYNPDSAGYSSKEIVMAGSYGITGRYGDIDTNQSLSYLSKTNYYGLKFDKSNNTFNHEDTTLVIENKYIRNRQTAEKLAEHLLFLYLNAHNIIQVDLPLKYYNLEVGDLCDFNEMILGKNIYGEKYVLSEPDDMPVRCGQYILPLFMVTEVTKSIKDVRVKLTQIHHNLDSDLVWDGFDYPRYSIEHEIGDSNLDGSIDVLDIINVVNHILNPENNPFTFTELVDMNEDGVINALDVVKLVNIIIGD